MRWRGEGHEYRITQIQSPRYVIERDDGQVVSESSGEPKIFFDESHAIFYADSAFSRVDFGSMHGRTVYAAHFSEGGLKIYFDDGEPGVFIQPSAAGGVRIDTAEAKP